MFACILILILVLPVTFVPLTVADLKANGELNEMGICLEHQEEPAGYFFVERSFSTKDCLMDQPETLPLAGELLLK